IGASKIALDSSAKVCQFRTPLGEGGLRLFDGSFGPAGLPDRNTERADNRKSLVELRRIHTDRAVVAAQRQRGKTLSTGRSPSALGGLHLRLGRFQILALVEGLLQSI